MDVLFIVVGLLLLMVLISTYFALAHYEAHKEAIASGVVAEPELITEAVPPDIEREKIRESQEKHRKAFRSRMDAAFKRFHEKRGITIKEGCIIEAEDSWIEGLTFDQQVRILEDKVATLEDRVNYLMSSVDPDPQSGLPPMPVPDLDKGYDRKDIVVFIGECSRLLKLHEKDTHYCDRLHDHKTKECVERFRFNNKIPLTYTYEQVKSMWLGREEIPE